MNKDDIGEVLWEHEKLGIIVSDIIKDYTSEQPYRLTWRYDFDETLISVCNINGERRNKDNLSEEDLDDIKNEYEYLKNTDTFIRYSGLVDSEKGRILNDGSSYIDYVNEGWPNVDGRTYSYREYLITEKGNRLDLYNGNDAELSEEGLFTFDNFEKPLITRVLEDNVQIFDYRT